jgi:hypothetical protein
MCRAPFGAITVQSTVPISPGINTGFLIARVMSLLNDYEKATDTAEKEYKLTVVARMVSRHYLQYDVRVTAALARHNIVVV